MTPSLAARAWRGRRANSALSKPSVNRRRPGCRVLGRAPAPLTRSNSSITQRSSVSSDRAIACSTVSRPRSTSPALPRQAASLPRSSTKRGRNPASPAGSSPLRNARGPATGSPRLAVTKPRKHCARTMAQRWEPSFAEGRDRRPRLFTNVPPQTRRLALKDRGELLSLPCGLAGRQAQAREIQGAVL